MASPRRRGVDAGEGTATASERRNPLAPYLLIAPGVLWLLVFFVVPIATLAKTSLAGEGVPWWDGYARAFTDYGGFMLRSLCLKIFQTGIIKMPLMH